MSGGEHLEVAAAIGRRLVRDALWSGRCCTWFGWDWQMRGAQLQPVYRTTSPALGNGTAGIGLFLAELGVATGDPFIAQAARGALAHAAARIGAWPAEGAAGLWTGLAGAAVAFRLAGAVLADEEWHRAAASALDALEARRPDAARAAVYDGEAGAIVAFLDAGRPGPALARAEALARAARREDGRAFWPSAEAEAGLVGYACGTAGIALALLDLHAATGEAGPRDLALEALAHEDAQIDPALGLWPDLRIASGPVAPAAAAARWPIAWLHGTAGGVPARLRLGALLPDRAGPDLGPGLLAIAASLDPMQALQRDFSVATGIAGNAGALMLAARMLGRPDLADPARRAAADGIARFAAPRMPWPCSGPPDCERPDLLFGLAGIGRFYLGLHEGTGLRDLLLFVPQAGVADAAARAEAPPPEPPAPADRAEAEAKDTGRGKDKAKAEDTAKAGDEAKPESKAKPDDRDRPEDKAEAEDTGDRSRPDPRAGRRRRRTDLPPEPPRPRTPSGAKRPRRKPSP